MGLKALTMTAVLATVMLNVTIVLLDETNSPRALYAMAATTAPVVSPNLPEEQPRPAMPQHQDLPSPTIIKTPNPLAAPEGNIDGTLVPGAQNVDFNHNSVPPPNPKNYERD